MKEAERITIRAREAAMQWAMQTAEPGEDPMQVLARAQLYEDYILPAENGRLRDGKAQLNKLGLNTP